MSFLSRIFSNYEVECPRSLGKGDVDSDDIRRLKKELYWVPGKCAYCNGKGKVSSKSAVDAGMGYLTTDLPYSERKRLLNGDKEALQRAKEHDVRVEKMIREIEHQYYIENQEADEIADYLSIKYEGLADSPTEKQAVIEYIRKVINSKLKNN